LKIKTDYLVVATLLRQKAKDVIKNYDKTRKYIKYDSESYYYAMGYRIYSAEFGRILAVAPLFEAMPANNP